MSVKKDIKHSIESKIKSRYENLYKQGLILDYVILEPSEENQVIQLVGGTWVFSSSTLLNSLEEKNANIKT